MPKLVAVLVHVVVLLIAVRSFAGKANGEACVAGSECNSTHCVDGVCCDSSCDFGKTDKACSTCNDPKGPGMCTNVLNAVPTKRTCAALPGPYDAACALMACPGGGSGTGDCLPLAGPNGKTCGVAKCADNGTFTPASTCLDGKCPAKTPTSCSPFKCTDAGCLKACTTDAECLGGFFCKVGNCIAGMFTCSDDKQGSLNADRVVTACSPYLCGDDGRCRETCRATSDCAASAVCDATSSKCIASASADEGGCAFHATPRTYTGMFLLVVGLIGITRKRHRDHFKSNR